MRVQRRPGLISHAYLPRLTRAWWFSTEDGHKIDLRTYGIVTMSPEAAKVFTLQPDMSSVPFGHIGRLQRHCCGFPTNIFKLRGAITWFLIPS